MSDTPDTGWGPIPPAPDRPDPAAAPPVPADRSHGFWLPSPHREVVEAAMRLLAQTPKDTTVTISKTMGADGKFVIQVSVTHPPRR